MKITWERLERNLTDKFQLKEGHFVVYLFRSYDLFNLLKWITTSKQPAEQQNDKHINVIIDNEKLERGLARLMMTADFVLCCPKDIN